MDEKKQLLKEVVDETAEKVKELIMPALTEETLKMVQSQVASQVTDRKGIFGNEDNVDKALDSKQKSADFLKELYQKSLTSGSSGNGSDLIPTFLADQFIGIAQNYGLARKRARHWPMEGTKQSIPTLGTAIAYRIDTDGNRITTSQPTTGTVNLSSKTTAVIIPVSKKLLQNSSIQLTDALSFIAGKALAKTEDTWCMNGLVSGEGILGNASIPFFQMASGNTLYNQLTAENLLSVIETVDESFFELGNMSWVWSLGVFNNIRRLRAAVGSDKQGFLFEGLSESNVPGTVWGLPYDLSPVMPNNTVGSQAGTKFAALVNWAEVIFGDDQNYTMEISNQATITDTNNSTLVNLFEQNMVAIKITGDIDIQFSNATKAHATLKTAAS